MACYSFQRTLYCSTNNFWLSRRLISFIKPWRSVSSNVLLKKGFCRVSCNLNSNRRRVAHLVSLHSLSTSAVNAMLGQDAVLESADCRDGLANPNMSNGGVMLIDGTSIIYRAHYKLLGTLENLLQCVEQVDEERIRKALTSNAEQALLSKNLAMLRSDLPFYMVPFSNKDLTFKKPEVGRGRVKSHYSPSLRRRAILSMQLETCARPFFDELQMRATRMLGIVSQVHTKLCGIGSGALTLTKCDSF